MQKLLTFALFFIVGTTMAGVGVIIALNTGMGTGRPILLAAACGFALALPVSWLIARSLTRAMKLEAE